MSNDQDKTPSVAPGRSQGSPAIQPSPDRTRGSRNIVILLLVVGLLAAASVAVVALLSIKTTPPLVDQDSPEAAVSGNLQSDHKPKRVCATHEKLCVNTPGGWRTDIEEGTYPAKGSSMAEGMAEAELVPTDKVVLTSPDGGLRVIFISGITGVGGRCDTDSPGRTFITQAKKTSLIGYRDGSTRSSDQAYAVSIITTPDGVSEFRPAIILTNSEKLIDKDQGHYCDSVFTDLINSRNIVMFENNGHTSRSALSLSTRSNYMSGSGFESQTFSSLDEAKQALDSQNYREAFEIIASARY